jgi:hypothetical protein
MNTYNDSYHNPQSANNKYTLTFKVPWEQHTQVQEVASKSGQNMADTCRQLLELGLADYNSREVTQEDRPKLQLFKEAARVRELQHLIQLLAEVKNELCEEDFQRYCQSLGIDPAEVEDVAIPRGKITKKERCCSFLRVLFTDRPEGLPANRVLEIAEREGFGQGLTRDVADEIGIRFQPTDADEGKIYMWIPPETL